jgi:uncharacterized protein with HEPN domain
MRSDKERLLDILEAIERIYRYAPNGRASLENNELVQNWVVSHIQHIGEACYGISQKLRASHTEVPWNEIIGMRHILVHNYFEIDMDVVAAVLEKDLPLLKPQIEAIIKKVSPDTNP